VKIPGKVDGELVRRPGRRSLGKGGSIIIIVMVTLLFTAAALVAFLDKASDDLLVEARSAENARLRPDAYSALEVTLAVLEDFREADDGLHHPNEGWGDPLDWAGWAPADGYTVDVAFQDESGKIPLAHMSEPTMILLFQGWGMDQNDAQKLTDELLTWMRESYTPMTALNPDYAQAAFPYAAPLRSFRSYSELAAIDGACDVFFTNGRPNDLYWRFYNDVSIFNFSETNINGANADVLAAEGQFTEQQDSQIAERLSGTLATTTLVHPWFSSAADLATAFSTETGSTRVFRYTVSALRILITVHDKDSQFRLSAVVSPAVAAAAGGANTVQATAADVKANNTASRSGESVNNSSVSIQAQTTTTPSPAQNAVAASSNIKYPFRILELLENDAIPTPPISAPPPTDGSFPPDASPILSNGFAPYSPLPVAVP
jgi:general secretion pathway protein K